MKNLDISRYVPYSGITEFYLIHHFNPILKNKQTKNWYIKQAERISFLKVTQMLRLQACAITSNISLV